MPKFEPTNPFTLIDSERGRFNADSEFISELVKEKIDVGGVWCQILLWEGTFQQDGADKNSTATPHPGKQSLEQALGIQDTILLEARDVRYSDDFIPVKGVYTVSQNELEYARFGFALANDVLTMEFHIGEIEKQCGRRLIPGDVIELPHLREVDIRGRVANKWYQVSSVLKSPGGYDPMYGFHIIAAILKPARNQQELYDIMRRKDEYGKTLSEQASTLQPMLDITEENQKIAFNSAYTTMWDTTPMYMDPTNQSILPQRFFDDGKPPNGIPVNSGSEFPTNPKQYDYFVRSDSVPNVLYQYYNSRWRRKEVDLKREWNTYNWTATLQTFLTNIDDQGNKQNYELKSIHDVVTDRQHLSHPTPGNDSASDVDDIVILPVQVEAN
jgi:hypothetical protein